MPEKLELRKRLASRLSEGEALVIYCLKYAPGLQSPKNIVDGMNLREPLHEPATISVTVSVGPSVVVCGFLSR